MYTSSWEIRILFEFFVFFSPIYVSEVKTSIEFSRNYCKIQHNWSIFWRFECKNLFRLVAQFYWNGLPIVWWMLVVVLLSGNVVPAMALAGTRLSALTWQTFSTSIVIRYENIFYLYFWGYYPKHYIEWKQI